MSAENGQSGIAQIIEQYNADDEHSVINTLTKEEAEQWLNEVENFQNILMTHPNAYPGEVQGTVANIYNALRDRLRVLNSDNGELESYNYGQIKEWLSNQENIKTGILSDEVKQNWKDKIQNSDAPEDEKNMLEILINSVSSGSDEDLKSYTYDQIRTWLRNYDPDTVGLSDDVKKAWTNTINNADDTDENKQSWLEILNGESLHDTYKNEIDDAYGVSDPPIYKEPNIILGSSGSGSLDDMISDADNFVQQGGNVVSLNPDQLQTFSQTLYNILLTVGIVVAVIVGSILGIKFMVASVDEKAKVKQMLVAYVIGCAVVFGSFGIWKIVVTILQNI